MKIRFEGEVLDGFLTMEKRQVSKSAECDQIEVLDLCISMKMKDC